MGNPAKKAAILGATALIVATLGAGPALAQDMRPAAGQAAPGKAGLARLLRTPYRPIVLELRGVKLTRNQRQQVLAIFRAHRPELQALAGKLRTARETWQQAGKIDIQQRNALHDQRQALLKSVNAEVLGVLTPEQQKQIEARRQRRINRGMF